MVLICHGLGSLNETLLYPLWIDQAVPLFLLIQVFHAYKKDVVAYPKANKLWHRIIKPFVAVQLVFVVSILAKSYLKDADSVLQLEDMLVGGGCGPGSYYIWIYLQIAILCPWLARIVRKRYALGVFAGVSILLEVFCSWVEIPEALYRLLFFRYFFLIYLGYQWVKNGIVLDNHNLVLSLVSIVCILLLFFTKMYHPDVSFEPFVFDTNWTIFHWFCYFLPWSLLSYLICRFYNVTSSWKLNKLIILCGKRSYEIFLFQMLIFGISPLPGCVNIMVSLLPLVVLGRRKIFHPLESKK